MTTAPQNFPVASQVSTTDDVNHSDEELLTSVSECQTYADLKYSDIQIKEEIRYQIFLFDI